MATDLSNLEEFLNFGKSTPENIEACLPSDKRALPRTPSDIIEKAKELGITTIPLDIIEIVTRIFDIEIVYDNFGKEASGFLERVGMKWFIFINANESKLRQRFTIAHELGHFIMHRDRFASAGVSKPDQIFFRNKETNKIEQEANEFASNLLMPADDFRTAIKNGKNTLDKLSDHFNLSTMAIKYRAYKLRIIDSYD